MLIHLGYDLLDHTEVLEQVLVKDGEESDLDEFTLLADDVAIVVFLVIVQGETPHACEMLPFIRDLSVHQLDQVVHESEFLLYAE